MEHTEPDLWKARIRFNNFIAFPLLGLSFIMMISGLQFKETYTGVNAILFSIFEWSFLFYPIFLCLTVLTSMFLGLLLKKYKIAYIISLSPIFATIIVVFLFIYFACAS